MCCVFIDALEVFDLDMPKSQTENVRPFADLARITSELEYDKRMIAMRVGFLYEIVRTIDGVPIKRTFSRHT